MKQIEVKDCKHYFLGFCHFYIGTCKCNPDCHIKKSNKITK